jgi:hypothetical protein
MVEDGTKWDFFNSLLEATQLIKMIAAGISAFATRLS